MSAHEEIAKLATNTTYALSGALVTSSWLQWLNTYAAACGVLLGFATFWVNFYYQHKNHQAIKARNDDDERL